MDSLLDSIFRLHPRRIQFNSEEQWTKALKFMLTNLKWGLAWVSSQFSEEQHGAAADDVVPTGSVGE